MTLIEIDTSKMYNMHKCFNNGGYTTVRLIHNMHKKCIVEDIIIYYTVTLCEIDIYI